MTIQKFIDLKLVFIHEPIYSEQVLEQQFILSYDLDTVKSDGFYEDNNFRLYVIAALHARGATNITGQLGSTLYFNADVPIGQANKTIFEWASYLDKTFQKNVYFMIAVVMEEQNQAVTSSVFEKRFQDRFITDRDSVLSLFP